MHDAFLDSARHLRQPDSTQTGQSQGVDPSPQQPLQVLDHLHELQADGTLELDDQIDVARLLCGFPREGAEQSDPQDSKPVGKLRVALPEAAEDDLLGEAAGWSRMGSHGGPTAGPQSVHRSVSYGSFHLAAPVAPIGDRRSETTLRSGPPRVMRSRRRTTRARAPAGRGGDRRPG